MQCWEYVGLCVGVGQGCCDPGSAEINTFSCIPHNSQNDLVWLWAFWTWNVKLYWLVTSGLWGFWFYLWMETWILVIFCHFDHLELHSSELTRRHKSVLAAFSQTVFTIAARKASTGFTCQLTTRIEQEWVQCAQPESHLPFPSVHLQNLLL